VAVALMGEESRIKTAAGCKVRFGQGEMRGLEKGREGGRGRGRGQGRGRRIDCLHGMAGRKAVVFICLFVYLENAALQRACEVECQMNTDFDIRLRRYRNESYKARMAMRWFMFNIDFSSLH
jgi:hypothetical protein